MKDIKFKIKLITADGCKKSLSYTGQFPPPMYNSAITPRLRFYPPPKDYISDILQSKVRIRKYELWEVVGTTATYREIVE